jgi:serine/threonine protein kinase
MQYCASCGGENSDKAKFCSTCGKPMMSVASPPVAVAAPSPPGVAAYSPPTQPAVSHQATLMLQSLLHGRYVVRKLLGQGGMGAVYLAEDQQVFNRLCVVKEMLPYYTTPAERQQAEQNFEREARLLASLRNPGIPQVYDYFVENSNYYLAMEWVEGENLEDHLARQGGQLPEAEVLDYAQQLAGILIHIARQNPPIIHRDIKPANVIVGADGQVKLVDFGIAKAATLSQTGKSIILGTPGYAPPEQYTAHTEPRTDIYAMGAMLHHLLTGRDPRNAPPFQFPLVRTLAPGVSPEIEKIVAEMLQPDPAFRPTAAELRVKLDSLLAPNGGTVQFQPFVFRSGAIAGNLHELALACDKNWDEAVEHLLNGDFETWLTQSNRPDLANRVESIKRRGGDSSAGLEEFIRAIDHTMLMPSLVFDQTLMDLGTVERGERRTVTVQLMNAGRGYLHGEVTNSVSWVRATPRGFGLREGQRATLTVAIDTGALNEGPFSATIFQATSNGGQAAIGLKADVTWQPKLEVEPAGKLDFGAVAEGQGQPVTALFTVRNTGGGALTGRLAAGAPWIQLDQDSFTLVSGADIKVTATANASWLGAFTAREGIIHITSLAGSVEKPALVRVRKAAYLGTARVRSWLVYGLFLLLGYVGAALPLSVGMALLFGWQRPDVKTLAVLGALLLLSPVAFLISRRPVAWLDEMEDYHHRGRLADDLLPSRFSRRKLAWLVGVVALLGGLLGWRFGGLRPQDATALWALAGALIGALAGGLLAAEGEGGPAISSRFWRGATLATSPIYGVLRSVLLLLAGGFLGMLAGAPIAPASIRPENAVVGALVGLLMSSESHRWLALRLRWLLMQARLAAWAILGAYATLSIVSLLQGGRLWTLLGYGYLGWHFTSVPTLLWLALYVLVAVFGALAGLWAADGAGQPLAKASRLFIVLLAVQSAAALPVYIVSSLWTGSLSDARVHMWINILAVLAASVGAAWALRFRLPQIEAALAKAGRALDGGWAHIAALLPGALGGAWRRLVGVASGGGPWKHTLRVPRLSLLNEATLGRWRGVLASLTLAELSADMTLPLAIAAIGVTVITQNVLATFVTMLIVGLGTLLLYALLLILAFIGLVLVVRYVREHK